MSDDATGLIAELIRTRSTMDGVASDSDVVVCFAADEARVLANRPGLLQCERIATRHLTPGVVLFLPLGAPCAVGRRLDLAGVANRDV